MAQLTITEDFIRRFESKIRKSDSGCWEWLASTDRVGYGHIWHNDKLKQSHRVAWEIYRGLIPDGSHILHSCDNRRCVNPGHLSLGTAKENVIDAVRKNRWIGRGRGKIRLDKETVSRIKWKLQTGMRPAAVARSMDLDFHLVYQIAIGRTWKAA